MPFFFVLYPKKYLGGRAGGLDPGRYNFRDCISLRVFFNICYFIWLINNKFKIMTIKLLL